jgi:VIT1/CCC1 family predicted Fe2+/Mn2+ transporter
MKPNSFHNLILGGQDGLVNVLGIMLGLSAAHAQIHLVVVACLAAGFSEAISMAGVAYTSSLPATVEETRHKNSSVVRAIEVGIYALIGALIPLIPFLFLNSLYSAIVTAIIISTIILFLIGGYRAKKVKTSIWRSGIQMVMIGALCAVGGFLIGLVLK